ncbi:MAG: T9SS type A sorting domain-containing protein, partial [Flavobacteriales bacterium]|nr:T9SS type A sorting domain-containing protein [Flavobacteriales bacterium]
IMMHLDISPSNNKLRIATHGRGLFERELEDQAIGLDENLTPSNEISLFPNPVTNSFTLNLVSEKPGQKIEIQLFDGLGKRIKELYRGVLDRGENTIEVSGLEGFAPGTYYVRTVQNGQSISKAVVLR